MKNTDTRVRYTKDVLKKALLEILKTKRIDRVTVKELCDKANINRGTFYLHYSTPNDLLYEIENNFIDNHSTIFTGYMSDASHQKRDEGMVKLYELFQLSSENVELSRVIFGPNGDNRFSERIKRSLKPEIINHWSTEFPKYKKEHLEFIFDYVYEGSMSLIFNWINADEKDRLSAEKLAYRLDRLGHYAHLAIQEFN